MEGQQRNCCSHCRQPADDTEGGTLVMPCDCPTSLHQRCVFKWLAQQQHDGCQACRKDWRGLLAAPTTALAEAVEQALLHAQQEEGQSQADAQGVLDWVRELGRRAALLDRQLLEAVHEQQKGAAAASQLRADLKAAQQEAAQLRRALTEARDMIRSADSAVALQRARRDLREAEAQLVATRNLRDRYQGEAELAWREKNEAQTELHQQRYRTNRQEEQNASLQAELGRLQARLSQIEPELQSLRQQAELATQARQVPGGRAAQPQQASGTVTPCASNGRPRQAGGDGRTSTTQLARPWWEHPLFAGVAALVLAAILRHQARSPAPQPSKLPSKKKCNL